MRTVIMYCIYILLRSSATNKNFCRIYGVDQAMTGMPKRSAMSAADGWPSNRPMTPSIRIRSELYAARGPGAKGHRPRRTCRDQGSGRAAAGEGVDLRVEKVRAALENGEALAPAGHAGGPAQR